MFVLEPTCTAPLGDVGAVLEAHVAWLDEQYAKGDSAPPDGSTPATAG